MLTGGARDFTSDHRDGSEQPALAQPISEAANPRKMRETALLLRVPSNRV
jgi:hypothetical protein